MEADQIDVELAKERSLWMSMLSSLPCGLDYRYGNRLDRRIGAFVIEEFKAIILEVLCLTHIRAPGRMNGLMLSYLHTAP